MYNENSTADEEVFINCAPPSLLLRILHIIWTEVFLFMYIKPESSLVVYSLEFDGLSLLSLSE